MKNKIFKRALSVVLAIFMMIPTAVWADETYWVQEGATWHYFDENGVMQTGWIQDGNEWYYMKANGEMQIGWFKEGNVWYYMDASGVMQTGWVREGSVWYYFAASGIMQTGWIQDGNVWYYFNANGIMQTGWFQEGNVWYYFNANGIMQTGWMQDGSAWYYFDKSGILQKGWINDGVWRFMDKSTGIMQIGWFKDGNAWYFLDLVGGSIKTGWANIDGSWYYFSESGIMQTGWQNISGKWYYLAPASGKITTGWLDIGNKRYYMNIDGSMLLGWLELGGKWYYLDGDGTMVKTSKVIDGKTYYFDSSGVWKDTIWEDFIYVIDPDGKERKVEPEILTDPQIGVDITEEEFLAAVIYTEANDQGYEGALMSALCVMNRVYTRSDYPNTLKFVIYADSQFAVVRKNSDGSDGPLTRHLKYIRDNGFERWQKQYKNADMSARVAVDAKAQLIEHVTKGAPRTIPGYTLPNGKMDFNYVMFMTPAAFDRNNLNPAACDTLYYLGHVYFVNWVRY